MKNANSKSLQIQGAEKTEHFTNCFLSSSITDGRSMAVNDKYLALTWIGKGQIKLLNPDNPINMSKYYPTVSFESCDILDMEFSPFDQNILSFGSENKSVYISRFDIRDENNISVVPSIYSGHTQKVNLINFNPIASNIMCSSTSYEEVHVWDSIQFETISSLSLKNPNCISWSPNGDLLGISNKNKILSIFDPRTKKENQIQVSNSNINPKFAWIDNNTIATIGWSRNAEKILSLLDLRKINSQNPNYNYFSSMIIDKNNYLTIPYVNPDLKLIYTVAKEESVIRIFDYNAGSLEKYDVYNVSGKNNFSVFLNRQYLNKKKKEIDKFARYTKERNIYYVSFYLKNDQDFNDIVLYPNEELSYPQMNHKDWISVKKFQPIPKKVYQKKPIQNNYNFTQNQEYDFDNNNSHDIIPNKLPNNNINNIYTQKFILKKQNQNQNEQVNKLKNNQAQKSASSKQQTINYELLYKKVKIDYDSLAIAYNNMENSLKEKEKFYNSQIYALKKKLEVENKKYIEEINTYKNLLQNKNNQDLLNSNLANHANDNKYQKLETKYNALNQTLNEYKQKEEKYSKNIAKLKSEINEKILLLDKKDKEIQNIKNTLKEKENIINNFTDEKRNDLNEKANLEQNVNELNKELNKLQQEINIKNNEKSVFG